MLVQVLLALLLAPAAGLLPPAAAPGDWPSVGPSTPAPPIPPGQTPPAPALAPDPPVFSIKETELSTDYLCRPLPSVIFVTP